MRSLESVSEFGGRADHLNLYNIFTGDPGYMRKDFGRYDNVDALTVMQAARRYLGPGRVVVEVVAGAETSILPNPLIPADTARARMAGGASAGSGSGAGEGEMPSALRLQVADDSARGSMPKGSAEAEFHLPPVQRATLSNGMQLLLVEKHELPVVNLHVVFPAGRAHDGPTAPGLAEMATAVWDEGTATRSAEEIASELGGMGASVSVYADWDTTSLRLFTLKRHLPKAWEIFADVVRSPSFPEEELDRQQKSVLGRLEQIRNEPMILASLAATQLLYGYDHPYGHPPWGNPAAVEGFGRADLKRFHEAYMRPEEAVIVAVGDVELDELQRRGEQSLGSWRAAAPAATVPNFALPPARPTTLVLIDKPHAAQSVIHIAMLGAWRNTPDYFAQNVMNMVFGGQFSSRLNMKLREQKGYTYGAAAPGIGALTSAGRCWPRRACKRPLPPTPWPSFSRNSAAWPASGRWRKRNSTSARSILPAAMPPASRPPRRLPRN